MEGVLVEAGQGAEGVEPGARGDRVEARPLPALEPQALAERMGHEQDVGEQDRCVEAVATDGLERDFRGQRRVVAQVEERARLGAGGAVFGQVAACLAHEPDGWR
jgi:hypothetical protein